MLVQFESASALKKLDLEKSALCQHVLEHDHVIDRENVEVFKSESHADRHRTAERFLINQKAKNVNVLNRNDGAILPAVYKSAFNFLIFCGFLMCGIPTQQFKRFFPNQFCDLALTHAGINLN